MWLIIFWWCLVVDSLEFYVWWFLFIQRIFIEWKIKIYSQKIHVHSVCIFCGILWPCCTAMWIFTNGSSYSMNISMRTRFFYSFIREYEEESSEIMFHGIFRIPDTGSMVVESVTRLGFGFIWLLYSFEFRIEIFNEQV